MTATNVNSAEPSIYSVSVKNVDGETLSLDRYKGKTILIVNTASACGYTPQYKGLENLYQKFKAKNFIVLAFPSNDFGAQEPLANGEIKKFCELKYKTTFPVFEKNPVLGPSAQPLFAILTKLKDTKNQTGDIRWNFEKFLINDTGQLVQRFKSQIEPENPELITAIEKIMK